MEASFSLSHLLAPFSLLPSPQLLAEKAAAAARGAQGMNRGISVEEEAAW